METSCLLKTEASKLGSGCDLVSRADVVNQEIMEEPREDDAA